MAFLEAASARQPGMPQAPEVSGATPRPSTPHATVTPPAAATSGPNGRPPSVQPPFSGRASASLPLSQAAGPAAPSMPSASGGSSTGPQKPQMPSAPVAPTAGVTPVQPQPQQAQIGQANPGPQLHLDRVPSRSELMGLPPGTTVQTPYGTMGGDGKLTLSPEGQEKYKEAIVQRRKSFGAHPFAGMPGAPEYPIELGKPAFNLFSGQWSR